MRWGLRDGILSRAAKVVARMMYFRPSYGRAPIEVLLDRWERAVAPEDAKDDSDQPRPQVPALQEFLEEDDLIPECRSDNQRLIEYLSQDAIIAELVRYVTVPAVEVADESGDSSEPRGPSDDEMKRMYKYPYMASEVLTAEVPRITTALTSSTASMRQLLSFVIPDPQNDETKPEDGQDKQLTPTVDPFLAGHFAKILTTVLRLAHAETLAHVRTFAPEFFPALLGNVSVAPIAELIVRIGEGPDNSDAARNYGSSPVTCPSADAMAVLAEHDVLEGIVAFVCSEISALERREESQRFVEGVTNAANVLLSLTMRLLQMPLLKLAIPLPLNIYLRPELIGRLLDASIQASRQERSNTPLILTLTLCSDLITTDTNLLPESISEHDAKELFQFIPGMTMPETLTKPEDKRRPIVYTNLLETELSRRFEILSNMLSGIAVADEATTGAEDRVPAGGPRELVNTSGVISPPLGNSRLKIAEFFVAVLRRGSPAVVEAVAELEIPKSLLLLLIKYCWSSMLHYVVSSAVETVMTDGPDRVRQVWFDAGLIGVLIDAWDKNEVQEGTQSRGSFRVGYMGHVIRMSATVRAVLATMSDDKRTLYASTEQLTKFDVICTTSLSDATELETRVLGGELPGGEGKGPASEEDIDEPTEVFSMDGVLEGLQDSSAAPRSSTTAALGGRGGHGEGPIVLEEEDEVVSIDVAEFEGAENIQAGDLAGPATSFNARDSGMGVAVAAMMPGALFNADDDTDSSDGDGTYESFQPDENVEKSSIPPENGEMSTETVTDMRESVRSDSINNGERTHDEVSKIEDSAGSATRDATRSSVE